MYSYKEFPNQVTQSMASFAEKNGFSLTIKKENHYLEYANSEWAISFYCDFGAVSLSLTKLTDGFKHEFLDLIRIVFPETIDEQEYRFHYWGCIGTIKYKVAQLEKYFPIIASLYEDEKGKLIASTSSRRDRQFRKAARNNRKKFAQNNSDCSEATLIENKKHKTPFALKKRWLGRTGKTARLIHRISLYH